MTLTFLSILSLAAMLLALAALPSASVALVVSRAASAGLRQGAWVALGIVAGDLLFVGLALLGLLALADLLGETFLWIKLLGGAYLIILGSRLLLRPPRPWSPSAPACCSPWGTSRPSCSTPACSRPLWTCRRSPAQTWP